ncbi:hypothetical protein LTR17_008978 [Elasticomyces elasticus]|nr:hypothetical protein LTR17_008978 [Elasticomyces elasticus]
MPDLDNSNGDSSSLKPTPIDDPHSNNMTDTFESQTEVHGDLATFKSHVSSLLVQVHKLTDRAQLILDFLNGPYAVRRFSIIEFISPMGFDKLLHEYFGQVTALTASQKGALFVKLREAFILENGGILLDWMRACVVVAWEKGEQMAKEAALDHLTHPATNEDAKVKVTKAYRGMLYQWGPCMDHTAQGFKQIEGRYACYDVQFMRNGGTQYGSSDLKWKEGLAAVRSMIDEAVEKYEMFAADSIGERDDEYSALEIRRVEEALSLARSVAAEYGEVKAAYEAAFASALKLAPEVFAYPSWCMAEAQ